MAFNQNELRAFLAIVDSGSVGQAASAVSMSQSALSRLLQRVETRLRAKLFDRSFTGMTLTPFGDALVPHARLLVFEASQALEAIETLRGLKRGRVRIGAVATITRSILAPAINRLTAAYPNIQIELLEAADDRLVTALSRREVDVMIAGDLGSHDDVLAVAECQFDDRYQVFCSSSHHLANTNSPTLLQIVNEKWIMPAPGATPRILFEKLITEAGVSMPSVAVETWSPSVMVAFVKETSLLGWLPTPLFASEQAGGLVRVLSMPQLALNRRFFVYRRPHGLLSPAAVQLVQELPLRTDPSYSRLALGQGV